VIVGHTHREMRDTVINGVHFVQPKNWAQVLPSYTCRSRETRRGAFGDGGSRGADSAGERRRIAALHAAAYRAHEAARLWAGMAVGSAGRIRCPVHRVQDTPLLDFINEVQRRKAGAQLSAAAAFDVQPGLPEGDVHQRDVAGVYPYENTLRVVDLGTAAARVPRAFRALLPHLRAGPADPQRQRRRLQLRRRERVRTTSISPVQPGSAFAASPLTARSSSHRYVPLALTAIGSRGGGYSMIAARRHLRQGEDIRELLVDHDSPRPHDPGGGYLRPSWAIIPIPRALPPAPRSLRSRPDQHQRQHAAARAHDERSPRTTGAARLEWSQNRPSVAWRR